MDSKLHDHSDSPTDSPSNMAKQVADIWKLAKDLGNI